VSDLCRILCESTPAMWAGAIALMLVGVLVGLGFQIGAQMIAKYLAEGSPAGEMGSNDGR
jgi:hypothetical protein